MAMTYSIRAIVGALASVTLLAGSAAFAQSAEKGPLLLEAKIPLGSVRGRIDHLAIDLKRQRLFVAELGNDSVGVVDLANRSLIRTIAGLNEPQGVGYEATTDTLFVANARDGSVQLFEGNDYKSTGRIELGSDADNIRIDAAAKRVVVGHGEGALTTLDPSTRSKIQSAPLRAHPESFQIDADSGNIFVNLPAARAVAVIEGTSGKQIALWSLDKGGNFPMAVDRARGQILIVFRSPPTLEVFSVPDGKLVSSTETCGDSDDLFIDAKRARVYVSCGAGYIDVFEAGGQAYRRLGRVATASGARTSFFAPDLDRLYLAVRATSAEPAAIWVYRPSP
jgi:YVTN family beta-propeller protein